ncbi:MAG: CHASE domain-containing protein [Microgenomates group bacterium]
MKNTIMPAILVTLASLLGTISAGYITSRAVNIRLQDNFNREADQIANTYYTKLHTHVTILEGMRGFWDATGNFTQHNLTDYLQSLDLDSIDKAGVSAYFYIPAIAKDNQRIFEKNVKNEPNTPSVYSTYTIHPSSTEQFLYPLTYGYPLAGRENVIGLDYGTISLRKDAIEYARDTGSLATTLAMTLQTTGNPGFFFFLPLYKSRLPLERLPERRLAFAGVVGASFRAESAFEQIFGGSDPYPYLDFQVYQGAATTPNRLLYDHDKNFTASKPHFTASRLIRLQDQTWTILIESKPSFSLVDPEQKLPVYVFAFGIIMTISLALFSTYKLSRIRSCNKL